MINKSRALYIFKYLWDHTDEEHPATTADIIQYLASIGISTTRKTVAEDAAELQNSGFDVICNRSRQNEFFIGSRHMELAELKMLVDAVQAAKFISPKKSKELIGKVTELASPYQSDTLKRSLFVDDKVKTSNESVYYAVDTLHEAIQKQKTVAFRYIEYTPQKKRAYKHGGQVYLLSPYDMVWNSDAYYVFGFSESHGKVVKFRVDRMTVFWTVFCGLFKILSSVFISCLEQKSIQLQIELEFSYSIFGEVCPRYRTRCIRQRMLRVLLLCDTHCGIPVLF